MGKSADLSCDIVFTANNAGEYEFEGKISVVIDVFRATSSIIAALEAGAARIVAVSAVEEARKRKADGAPCGRTGRHRIESAVAGCKPAN